MQCYLLALLVVGLAVVTSARVVRRETPPCSPVCADTPLDVSFIVDGSSSIWSSNFSLGLWFVAEFLDQFTIGPDRVMVSMITYGDHVYTYDGFDFGSHRDKGSLKQAIVSIPYRHGTATETGAAIRWFLKNQYPQHRRGVKHILVVLTDGNSQEPDVTKEEAGKALDAGLEVFAIGVGQNVTLEELHNIASDERHVYDVIAYNALSDIISRLMQAICGDPAEPIIPEPIVVDCRFSPVDIAFVLDSSKSIGEDNFPIELQFIKAFLEDFVINATSTRVAAVMYGDKVYEKNVINFDQFNTKKETLDAILNLPFKFGDSTQTAEGIDYMLNHFQPQFRSTAPNIAIVITDGNSHKGADTVASAARARDLGITMVAVGIGDEISRDELNQIAGDPNRVLKADNVAALDSIRQSLMSVTCSYARGRNQ